MTRRGLLRTAVLILAAALVAACDTSLTADNPYDPDLPAYQQEPASLVGAVSLEAGAPDEAMVEVVPSGKTSRPQEDGSFEVLDLPPGTYTVQVTAAGHRTWQQAGVFFSAGQRVNMGTISVLAARGSMTGHVVLKLDPDNDAGSHGGAVVFARASLDGRLAAGDSGSSTISNPDGTWTITDVPVGVYQLDGSKEGYAPSPPVEVEVTEDETSEVPDLVLRSITGVISIDEGAAYTNDPDGNVMVTVLAFETDEMQISEDPEFGDAAWEQHNAQRAWTLSSGDGEKTVFMRFRNASGYETPAMNDTIVLDRDAPTAGSVQIASGAAYVRDAQVALTLSAQDALSGVASVRTALDGQDVAQQPWVDYTTQLLVELPVGQDPDGVSSAVQAQFRDGAGNEGPVVEDAVIVDAVAPTDAALEIDFGAARTASRDVTLTLSAAGAREMQVSNDSGLAGAEWQPYSPGMGWRLTENDEQKTVFARFRDGALNASDIVEDGIELNTRGSVSGAFTLEGAAADGNADITVALGTEPPTTTVTAQDGSFGFADVPVGVYSLAASKAGFHSVKVPYLEVRPGEDATLEADTLTALRGGLTGFARRQGAAADGNAGIVVEVVGSGKSTVTNAAGEWTVENLPVAQFTVRATAEGYLEDSEADVSVAADTVSAVPDLVLAPNPGSISGAVALEGQADPDLDIAEVVVAGQTVPTAADGSFAVSDVAAGVYTLLARAPGFAPSEAVVSVSPGQDTAAGTIALQVARGHLAGTAERDGETDHSGIVVEVQGTGFSALTNALGEWSIRGVPVGQYTVRASATNFNAAVQPDVDVVADVETPVPLLLLTANPGSVTGFVELEGQPDGSWDGVSILVEGPGLGDLTAADGSFEVQGVPAGTYPVVATMGGYTTAAALATVQAGQASDVGVISLSIARGAITGVATLAGATDHSGITVEVDGQGYAGVTGLAGSYRIESIPVGSYTLTARKSEYVTRPVGAVTVLEGQTVAAASVELVRALGDFEIRERASGDMEYINDPAVALVFSEIPSDSADIWVAEDAGFSTGTWAPFSGSPYDYDLQSGDGPVSVFVKFRSSVGVESPVFTSSTVLDRVPPRASSSVLIDSGADFSTNPSGDVSLTLAAEDEHSAVARMRIAVDGAIDGETDEAFNATKTVRVGSPTSDGLKTVLAEYIDLAGNPSAAPASDTIYLDRAEPVNDTIAIDAGATYATGALVTLTLFAEDVCAAGYPTGTCAGGVAPPARMMLSNDPGFPGAEWEAYAVERAWFLKPGDGTKTVYVRYRDAAGNATAAISDDIELDPTPPGSPQITVQGGEITGSRDVTLALSAAGTPTEMIVAEGGDFASATWEPYDETPYPFTLSAGDGLKTVAARFRDAAGNESLAASDTVTLDTQPPGGTVAILEGPYVAVVGVTLSLTAAPDAARVCVYGDVTGPCDPASAPATWAVFAPTLGADLTAGDSPKTVRVQLADTAGNKGAELTAATTLDATDPTGIGVTISGVGPAGYTRAAAVTLTLSATDATSGVSEMMLANDAAYTGASWQPFSGGASWTLGGIDGDKTVYLKVRDRAGNEAETTGAIVLDRAAPTAGQPVIDGGAAYTTGTAVSVDLTGSDNLTAAGDLAWCLSNNATFDGAECGTGLGLGGHPWTLTAGDGEKTVYARVTDEAGHVTESSAGIQLDGAAPTGGSLLIDGGEYTQNASVNLALSAQGAAEMCLYGDITGACVEASDGDWIPFATSATVDLSGPDGLKAVRVKYRDAAHNATGEAWDTVTLDGAKPAPVTLSVIGTGPAGFSRNADVTLQIAASDATSGLSEMMVTETACGGGAWEGFAATRGWTLSEPDGSKTVCVRVRDRAGNFEDSSAVVVLDRQAPTLDAPFALTGDGGEPAGYSYDASVTADFAVSDNVDNQVQLDYWLANDPSFTGAAAVDVPAGGVVSTAWTLTAGDGSRTAYVRIADRAGNQAVASAGIVVDSEGPAGGGIAIIESAADPIPGNGYTNQASITVNTPASGASDRCVYGDLAGAAVCAWEGSYADSKVVNLDTGTPGTKQVSVQYRDAAGHVAGPYSATIEYDGTAPASATVTVAGGATHTNDPVVTLTLAAADADSGISEMRIANGAAAGGDWEPYATGRSWTLAPGVDGNREVTVEFRDRAGNPLDDTAAITLDTAAPQFTAGPTLSGDAPDDRAGYTRDTGVTAGFTVQDALEAEDTLTYCIANNPAFDNPTCGTPPATGVVLRAWTLSAGEESKTAYFKARDRAGNEVTGLAQIVLDSTAPLSPTLLVDGADTPYTLDDQITVHLGAVGASQVWLSENGAAPGRDDLGWAAFDPGAPTAVVDLSDSEGAKTVYAFYQDPAGNVTAAAVSDGTFYDTTAPTGTALTITGTSLYDRIGDGPVDDPRDDSVATMTATVSLTLAASDGGTGSGVTEMLLSNDSLFSGAVWQPYQTDVDLWALLGGAANYVDRTVYAKFQDAAGRESSSLSATIKLDNTAPTAPAVSIEGGDPYVAGTLADVTLTATSADYRQLSMDPAFGGEVWRDFTSPETVNSYDLGGEGTRTVYVRYRDGVGNRSALASDSIIADDAAPTQASVLVNNDSEFTRNVAGNVTLVLHAEDQLSGVAEMRFSNDDATWSGWLPYATTYGPWTLDTPSNQNDVVKTVYAQFRDHAGQTTASVSDTIRLDNVRPTIDAPGLQINGTDLYTTQAYVSLSLPATDAFELKISDGSGCSGGTWMTYAGPNGHWVLEEGDEEVRTISAVVRDEAGNPSVTCSEDSITIDTAAPVVQSITLDGCADSDGGDCEGAGGGGDGSWDPYYTNDRYVTLSIDVSGTCDEIEVSLLSDFSGVVVPYPCTTIFPVVSNFAQGAADAERMLYVRAIDLAGNVSNVMQKSVWKDNKLPKFRSVAIEGGAPVTDDTTVDLTLHAQSDGSPMYQMFIDEDSDPLDQTPVSYSPTYSGFVFSQTGLVTATVAFEDTAGNRTDALTHVSDNIFIDTKDPNVPSITKICAAGTNPATCPAITRTKNTEVTLVFSASDQDEQAGDGGSGVAEMKVAEGSAVTSLLGVNWQEYKSWLSYQLPSENGTKQLWFGVRDQVEHERAAASSVSVVLDTEKPVVDGQIVVNDGDLYTSSVDVTMTSAVWDNLDTQGQLEMTFNCTNRIALVDGQPCVNGTWYPYNSSAALRLLAPDGLKKIWVAFRDRAGNTTGNFLDEIYLDTAVPNGTSIYYISPGNHQVDLAWNASTSGDVTHYKLYWGLRTGTDDPADYPNSIDLIDAESYTHIGVENIIYPYFYRVAAVDRAGNESALSDEVTTVAGWQVRRPIDPDQMSGRTGPEVAVADDNTIWAVYTQDATDMWVTFCSDDCYDDASWTSLQLSADAEFGNIIAVNHVPFIAFEEGNSPKVTWCEAGDCSNLANWTTASMSETGVTDVRIEKGGASNMLLAYRRAGGLQVRNCYWFSDCSSEGSWAAETTVDATLDDAGQVLDMTHSNEFFWLLYASGDQYKIASCLSWLGCSAIGQWDFIDLDSTTASGDFRHFSIHADDSNSHADGQVMVAYPVSTYGVRLAGCGFATNCQLQASWGTYYDLPGSPLKMYPVLRTTYDGLFVAYQDRSSYNMNLDFCYFGYDRAAGLSYCQDAANWYTTTIDDMGQTGYRPAVAMGGGLREPVIMYDVGGADINRMALPYEFAPKGFFALPAPNGYYFAWENKPPDRADGYKVVFDYSAAVPGGVVPGGWTGGFHDLFKLGGFSTSSYLSERDYDNRYQYLFSLKSYKGVYDTGASSKVHEVRPFEQIDFDDPASSSQNSTAGIAARDAGSGVKQVFMPILNKRTSNDLYLTMKSCIGTNCRNPANWTTFDLMNMGSIGASNDEGGNPSASIKSGRVWTAWYDRVTSRVRAAFCVNTIASCQNPANWETVIVRGNVGSDSGYTANLSTSDGDGGDRMYISFTDHSDDATPAGVYLAFCDTTLADCSVNANWTKTPFDSSAAGTPRYRHTSVQGYAGNSALISYQMDDELKFAGCLAAGCANPAAYGKIVIDTNPDYDSNQAGWSSGSLIAGLSSYRIMYDNGNATRVASCRGNPIFCLNAANWSSIEIPGTKPLNAALTGDRRLSSPLTGLFGLTSDENGFLSVAWCGGLCTVPESWRIGQLDDKQSNYFSRPQLVSDVWGSINIVRSDDNETGSHWPNILFNGFVRKSD